VNDRCDDNTVCEHFVENQIIVMDALKSRANAAGDFGLGNEDGRPFGNFERP
jgi:hypothetical protein